MNLLDKLNWRYATKLFDPERKVNAEQLEFLKEAIRLSVSSYGLQLYKVFMIEDPELRKKLRKASWDQRQITDASHLFVFCNYTTGYEQHIDDFVQRILEVDRTGKEGAINYGEFIKNAVSNMGTAKSKSWSEKQTYLALNNLLIACAELKIDACPMEGFDGDMYNKILGLDKLGLNAAVVATVGYRSANDHTQKRKKIRKSINELFVLK